MKSKDLKRKFMGNIRQFRSKKFHTDIDLCQEEDKEIEFRIRNKKATQSQNEILKNVTNFMMRDSPDIQSPPTNLLKKRSGIAGNKVVILKPDQEDSENDVGLANEKSFEDILVFTEKFIEKNTHRSKNNKNKMEKKSRRSNMINIIDKPVKIKKKKKKFEIKHKELEIVGVNDDKTKNQISKNVENGNDFIKPSLMQILINNLNNEKFLVETEDYIAVSYTHLTLPTTPYV